MHYYLSDSSENLSIAVAIFSATMSHLTMSAGRDQPIMPFFDYVIGIRVLCVSCLACQPMYQRIFVSVFQGLLERGGNTGPHKDGWGITFYEGKGCRTFKDPEPSCQSEIAKLVKAYPIKSISVISHIRQGNRGRVCLENTTHLLVSYGDVKLRMHTTGNYLIIMI